MGMTLPGSTGGLDNHWAFTGGSLFTGAGVGIGGAQGVIMSHVSDSWTVTPGVVADTYKIYYWTVSGGGTFSAQATGGSLVSVSTASGSSVVQTQTITASAASSANTVALICTTAGAGCVIFGVEFWDSTNPNKVRVLPAGCPGQDTNAFATGTALATYGSLAVCDKIAPDLTICSLGINDNYHSVALSTTQANMATLASHAQVSGDMLFMSAIPPSTGNAYGISVSAINAWLLSLGGAYIDLQTRYGTNFFATGLQTTDKIHPNALGYFDIASVVANALVR
jgi:lysophospholipase L1-like esterase